MSTARWLRIVKPTAVSLTLLAAWFLWDRFDPGTAAGKKPEGPPSSAVVLDADPASQSESAQASPEDRMAAAEAASVAVKHQQVALKQKSSSAENDGSTLPATGKASKPNDEKTAQSPPASTEKPVTPSKGKTQPRAPPEDDGAVIVKSQTIKDLDGKVVYRGDIDLTETLERIAANKRLRFRNDGSIFQNREKRLPAREQGYYQEWVHLTPELDGPGPQRVVTGKSGEIYYTADHYRTFRKLK